MKKISVLAAMRSCMNYSKIGIAQREELQRERLKRMVCFARQNSPYYAALYQNIGEDSSLSDLPTVSKEELMERWDDWVTDRNVSLAENLWEFMRTAVFIPETVLSDPGFLKCRGRNGK